MKLAIKNKNALFFFKLAVKMKKKCKRLREKT